MISFLLKPAFALGLSHYFSNSRLLLLCSHLPHVYAI